MIIHLTVKSSNKKTGPIPVSTSSAETCPKSCPLKISGCYAKSGPLALHWQAVTQNKRGLQFDGFIKAIKKLPNGQLWRHNQAGDLAGNGENINAEALAKLIDANRGKRGFTYTHYDVQNDVQNRELIKIANSSGFTVNLSANNAQHADQLLALNIGPVVVIQPEHSDKVSLTPKGAKIVTCPAVNSDRVTCASCCLCQLAKRDYIIGFPVHGTGKKKAAAVLFNGA